MRARVSRDPVYLRDYYALLPYHRLEVYEFKWECSCLKWFTSDTLIDGTTLQHYINHLDRELTLQRTS